MRWLSTLPLRIRSLFHRAHVEAELDAELRDHLERQTEANVAAGMSEAEARSAAARLMGSVELRKEECRDAFGWRALDTLRRDVRYAGRRLTKDWQFSIAAMLILGVGIGANTAVFSMVNNMLFRPFPFGDSERLVDIYQNEPKSGEPEGISYPALLDLKREKSVFQGVIGHDTTEGRYQTVDAQGRPGAIREAMFEYVDADHLNVLRMKPARGRWFTAEEERGSAPVALIGWRAWVRNFGADPNVIGQTIRVSGAPVKVIGVGPKELNNSESDVELTELWLPLQRMDEQRTAASDVRLLDRRDVLFLRARARLKDGVTIEQARAAMAVVAGRLSIDHPETDPGRGITVLATDDVHLHPRFGKLMWPLAAAVLTIVGLVLAIACSNLATLLLVRSSARATEVSVRLALGATRAQLVRQLLVESMVLSLTGAALGLALAWAGLRLLSTVDLPAVVSMELDYRVLLFAMTVGMLCGTGCGLTPALQVTRGNLAGALREQKRASAGSISSARGWLTMKNALIVAQVAASFLLLMGAALTVSMLSASRGWPTGHATKGLAMVESDPRYAGYDAARAERLFEEVRRRVAQLPGVESVIVTTGMAPGAQFQPGLFVEGKEADHLAANDNGVEGRWAGPGYFATLGIPVLFGREFDDQDTAGKPEVVVVSQELARKYFGTVNAIGRRLRIQDEDAKPVEIVGVVGDIRAVDVLTERPRPFFYRSARQVGVVPSAIVARTRGNEAELVGLMRQEVQRLHPELTVNAALTMEQRQTQDLAPFRMVLAALGALGALGLALAAIGLYAVVGFAVAQRLPEIGIRIALGAGAGDLTWLVVREVTALVLAGIAIGVALSWTGLILVQSALGPILGANPLAAAGVALVIASCGALAAGIPARRAVAADPLTCIRQA